MKNEANIDTLYVEASTQIYDDIAREQVYFEIQRAIKNIDKELRTLQLYEFRNGDYINLLESKRQIFYNLLELLDEGI
jgi:hypothetical protein